MCHWFILETNLSGSACVPAFGDWNRIKKGHVCLINWWQSVKVLQRSGCIQWRHHASGTVHWCRESRLYLNILHKAKHCLEKRRRSFSEMLASILYCIYICNIYLLTILSREAKERLATNNQTPFCAAFVSLIV